MLTLALNTPHSWTSLLTYTVLAPAAFALILLTYTYVFTHVRYKFNFSQNKLGKGRICSPIKIPYTLPFLGSSLQFLIKKPGLFWDKLFSWYPRATGSCTLKMGGQSMHVLFDPSSVQALFKTREANRDQTDYGILEKAFGLDHKNSVRYLGIGEPPSEKLNGRTPRQEQERISVETLLKTERVNELTSKFTEVLKNRISSTPSSEQKSIEVNLYKWLRTVMFEASTTAFFGTTCLQDYPNLEEDVFDFDRNFLDCYFGIPRWVSPEAYITRDKLHAGLTHWHERNLERNKGQVIDPESLTDWEPIQGSRANRARQLYYSARGLDTRSRAIMDLGLMFGLNSNAIPTAGWMLMHILASDDKTLYPRIMEEITNAQKPDGALDIATLVSQPLLLSTLTETLRMYVDGLVTREIPHGDLTLPIGAHGDKLLLRKNSLIVAPTWLQHRSEAVWDDAQTWRAERFLTTDDAGKTVFSTVGTGGKFFPWGGGKTICPGRVFAKQEVIGSVAMVLSAFRVEVLGFLDGKGKETKSFPGFADAYPGSGAISMGGDLKVRITRRV